MCEWVIENNVEDLCVQQGTKWDIDSCVTENDVEHSVFNYEFTSIFFFFFFFFFFFL